MKKIAKDKDWICRKCGWCERHEEQGSGDCHRYPPDRNGNYVRVLLDKDFCGEWRELNKPSTDS